jgi:hypothetical protein
MIKRGDIITVEIGKKIERLSELEVEVVRLRARNEKLREGLERLLIATKGYSIPTHELMAAEKALQEVSYER